LNGSLYGTFGINGAGGGVYVLNASGTERVVNANFFYAEGLTAVNGLLYFVGYVGQNGSAVGLYSLTPSGSSKLVSSFSHLPVFVLATGQLIYVDGTFYGTDAGLNNTVENESDYGAEYAVSPSGTASVLYQFKGGANGEYPESGLLYSNGNLYGTTSCYESYYDAYLDCGGTVFSMTPTGTANVLYQFKGGTDGIGPVASLIALHGVFYGTTVRGGRTHGTVFAISPSGAEHVVYRFKGMPDGSNPEANLTAVGNELYGTTFNGGANGLGTIFRVSTAGVEEVVHSFSRADGTHPVSGLIYQGGLLYGTTPGYGNGTVFERKP
jgi:uncharacterized repeat protein (TIGR03803 family)